MLVLNQPQDKDSNAKIVDYFANHSHRVHGLIGFFVFIAGLLFLLAFPGAAFRVLEPIRLASPGCDPRELTQLS